MDSSEGAARMLAYIEEHAEWRIVDTGRTVTVGYELHDKYYVTEVFLGSFGVTDVPAFELMTN